MSNKMNLKQILIKSIKIIVALLCATVILCIFCVFYYNPPADFKCEDGATDFYWKPNTFFSVATEGYAIGKTNNEGYLNLYDYKEGMPIDVLLMGSSHMEAYQVNMKDSTAGVLDSMLKDKNVYNIGASSHTLLVCADNLKAAVEKYQPTKYIVIEAMKINFSDYDLSKAIEDDFDIQGLHFDNTGISGAVKNNGFVNKFCSQSKEYINESKIINLIKDKTVNEKPKQEEISPLTKTYNDPKLLDTLIKKIKNCADKSGAKVIIVYHPDIHLQKDGSLRIEDAPNEGNFIKACNDNGVIFLDMKERFLKEYKESYLLPYGFSNSSVGNGHLNKNGHRMIAEELFAIMEEDK